jgi:hypothetical protein
VAIRGLLARRKGPTTRPAHLAALRCAPKRAGRGGGRNPRGKPRRQSLLAWVPPRGDRKAGAGPHLFNGWGRLESPPWAAAGEPWRGKEPPREDKLSPAGAAYRMYPGHGRDQVERHWCRPATLSLWNKRVAIASGKARVGGRECPDDAKARCASPTSWQRGPCRGHGNPRGNLLLLAPELAGNGQRRMRRLAVNLRNEIIVL